MRLHVRHPHTRQCRFALVFVLLASFADTLIAQSRARPQILVLGTYHTANGSRNVHDMQADDVRSDKRQGEMNELVEVLKRFRPTRIAVEAPVGDVRVTRAYADYLAGKRSLSADETEQIGFRLAKALGHSTVYPVNEEGDFPILHVITYAKANDLKGRFDTLDAMVTARVKSQGEMLATHTILQTLEYMNTDSSVARTMAADYAFVPFGEPQDYAGPDLLASWFQRNIRIYHNIRALVTSPGERILVIYGAGHLPLLRQDVENDGTIQLKKLADLMDGGR